mmetsp:Transcript_6586/g.17201  ORF Transcript_6586/g.17201 Transcript_6586/m.17201 type:complete len:159 (-) Transcript_6586:138-614(-)
MIAAAPTIEDRVPGAKFLALILSDENTYFERAFRALGVDDEARASSEEPETRAFIDLMLTAARSTKLHVMLAVLVVAEWSYLEWGTRVEPKPGLAFYHQEWIDLHRGPDFEAVVVYLRGLLDKIAPTLSDADRDEAKAAFRAAVQCEVGFWAMARRAA